MSFIMHLNEGFEKEGAEPCAGLEPAKVKVKLVRRTNLLTRDVPMAHRIPPVAPEERMTKSFSF